MRSRGRLLVRDFTVDINDPESSSLSDDQLKIVYVATVLEEMFAAKRLDDGRRNLLLRLYEEVSVSGVDDQDRRFLRATKEIEQRVATIKERKRSARAADAIALLVALESHGFAVHEPCQDKTADILSLLKNCEPARPRPKGSLAPAGVLARILFLAGLGVGSVEGFVKRINSALTREGARDERRSKA